MMESAGLTVHVFTSPHLVRFNERIRIAGKLIGDDKLSTLLKEVLDASAEIEPSFFEVTTAAAFLAFARTPADACVLEVGLGGRLDATNVVKHPLVCGMAGLGIDHKQWLGRKIGDIASEKAGIAKPGVPLVTQRYPPRAAQRVMKAAEVVGAPWIGRGALWEARVIRGHIRYRDRTGSLDLPMPRLPGRYQADNAALAVAMLRHQHKLSIADEALAEGITAADWPARMQRLAPGPLLEHLPEGSELWLDGGHNASAARLVADFFRRSVPADLPLVLLFASLSTKDPRAMLKPFRELATEVHTLPIPDHEHRPPKALAQLAEELGFTATANAELAEALRRIEKPSRVLIFGSLYLSGDVLRANGEIPR
jgi:dihydrofolate synthase/folylpolyglutamate synthase